MEDTREPGFICLTQRVGGGRTDHCTNAGHYTFIALDCVADHSRLVRLTFCPVRNPALSKMFSSLQFFYQHQFCSVSLSPVFISAPICPGSPLHNDV